MLLEPVKTFATSNDDVGPSLTAALGLLRSRTRTKSVMSTIETSQVLFMPSIPTGDPEAPSAQATEKVPSSWVEGNHPAQIRSCSRILPEVEGPYYRNLQHSRFSCTPSETTAARNVTITSRFILHQNYGVLASLNRKGKKSQLYKGSNWRH